MWIYSPEFICSFATFPLLPGFPMIALQKSCESAQQVYKHFLLKLNKNLSAAVLIHLRRIFTQCMSLCINSFEYPFIFLFFAYLPWGVSERESSWISFMIFYTYKKNKCTAPPSQEEGMLSVNAKWKLCPPCPFSAFSSHYYSRLNIARKRIKTWRMWVYLENGKENVRKFLGTTHLISTISQHHEAHAMPCQAMPWGLAKKTEFNTFKLAYTHSWSKNFFIGRSIQVNIYL